MTRAPGLAPGTMRMRFTAPAGTLLALAQPGPMFGLRLSGFESQGLDLLGEAASQGSQRALIARVSAEAISLSLHYAPDPAADEDWLWAMQPNPRYAASPELCQQIRAAVHGMDAAARLQYVMQHVTTVFHYGHGEGRFDDGHGAIPALSCGTTRGSCVDIHTYAVAALQAADIPAAYIAGVFWPEPKREASSMHCWIKVGGALASAWDLSHDLIAGRRPVADFHALPGTRLPLSAGPGLHFTWQDRSFEISHFALPHVIECAADDGFRLRPCIERLD
ncbi:MAG: transglutaminase-like domain-containing protein [Panacagrimonas sp.]